MNIVFIVIGFFFKWNWILLVLGRLGIVDHDVVELNNMHRQVRVRKHDSTLILHISVAMYWMVYELAMLIGKTQYYDCALMVFIVFCYVVFVDACV